MKEYKIIRWITIGILFASLLFFFFPYVVSPILNMTGMDIVKMGFSANSLLGGEGTAEIFLRFAAPVILLVLCAIFLLIRTNLFTTILSSVMSIVAFLFTNYAIGELPKEYVGFGLRLNQIVCIIGIILPIVLIIIKKLKVKKEDKK